MQMVVLIGLLLAVSAAIAVLLRFAGAPGWPVLGGVVAGVLLGPTLFGRVMPTAYESLVVGGAEQREALERLLSRHGADLIAAEAAALDAHALAELRREHAQQRTQLETALRETRWEHEQPMRLLAGGLAAIVLLGAARLAVPKRPPVNGRGQHVVSAISIGTWSAIVPGAIAYLAAVRWWGWSPAEAAIVAAAVMIGPWALTAVDREAADQAEHGGAHLIQTAGYVASIFAIAVAAWAFYALADGTGLIWASVLAVIAVGWLLSSALGARATGGDANAAAERLDVRLLTHIAIPSLAALAAVRIELFAHFAIWPILVLLLLSGDGRWLGAFIGAMTLGGRGGFRTMRLVLGSMACGPTQVAVVALAAGLWIMPPEAAMALVLGAVLIEVSAPLRRSLAQKLTDAEEWELE